MPAATSPPTIQKPGQIIRSARERRKLTREEFARRAGISTSALARLELYDQFPHATAARRIAGIAEQAEMTVADVIALADRADREAVAS